MIALINNETGAEYPRYFKDKEALLSFVIETYGSEENAPDNLGVKVLSDKEYQDRVTSRGESASKQMQKNIELAREAEQIKSHPTMSALFPYTAKHNIETGGEQPFTKKGYPSMEDIDEKGIYTSPISKEGFQAGLRDFYSLPGRALTRSDAGDLIGFGGIEQMGVLPEKREGFIDRTLSSPELGASVVLTPLALAAGAPIGGALASGAVEGAVLGAGTSAFQYATEKDYSIADGVVETILSAALGAGLKKGSKAFIDKAKSIIATNRGLTQEQVNIIYSKLGITQKGTEKNIRKDISGDISDLAYTTTREGTTLPSGEKILPTTDMAREVKGDMVSRIVAPLKQDLDMSRAQGILSYEEYLAKSEMLERFVKSTNNIKSLTDKGQKPYLGGYLKEAEYYATRYPELSDRILLATGNDLSQARGGGPALDFKEQVGDILTLSRYASEPPAIPALPSFEVTKPMSWVSPARALVSTPERSKVVGESAKALRGPLLEMYNASDAVPKEGRPWATTLLRRYYDEQGETK